MVFRREEPGQWKAGALAVLVHLLFLGVLIFGVSWQNSEPAAVEVQLWSDLPGAVAKHVPPPLPKPQPKPEPEPKPKLKPVKAEPQPEAKPSRAEIELKAKEAKRKEEDDKKRKVEELKQREDKLKLEREKRKQEDDKKHKEETDRKTQQEKAERQREQEAQAEAAKAQKAQVDAAAAQQAARGRAVEGYVGKLVAKIRPRIVSQPCQPLGDPEVRFAVTLMPTGELLFDPKLVKSSGVSACDQAIERAIMLAQPFPKPDPSLGIRDLTLIFWPNRKE